MVTGINRFAKIAGYSPSTISRAFNNGDRMSPETQQRIMKMAFENGYSPDPAARVLKKGRRDIVGLTCAHQTTSDISHHQDAFMRSMTPFIRQLALLLEKHNMHLMMGMMGESLTPQTLQQTLPRVAVGGYSRHLVVLEHMWPELAETLRRCGKEPIVVHGPSVGCDAVQRDEVAAAEALFGHFHELGHRRIAFLNHELMPEAYRNHYREDLWPTGYLKAVTKYQLAPVPGWDDFALPDEALDRLLALPEPPTALIAYDEDLALLLVKQLKRRGLAVPDRISVGALLDTGTALNALMPVTHVTFPHERAARQVVSWILEHPDETNAAGRPRVEKIPGELFAGDSSGPAAGGGRRRDERAVTEKEVHGKGGR